METPHFIAGPLMVQRKRLLKQVLPHPVCRPGWQTADLHVPGSRAGQEAGPPPLREGRAQA